ncbi:RDD family protein [Micromonospora sp. CA-248260]|uniref:RDD family protein n=1 Tax=Micromonospora sp. CA-248260 TaxID=3239962 RepID=UPI003D90B769
MTSSPAAPVPPATDPAFTPPTLGRRFGALVIDWVLCLLVANFFADPVRDGWAPVAVLIAEYGLFLGLFAQTPGMRITRLRCLDWSDGGRIGVPRALLRGLLLALVVPPLIMDEQRRGLHDRLTGAVIADAPRPTT